MVLSSAGAVPSPDCVNFLNVAEPCYHVGLAKVSRGPGGPGQAGQVEGEEEKEGEKKVQV